MKTWGSGLGLVLLALAVPADWAGAADCLWAQGDAHSLCYIFSFSASGPSWCEFVGMINGTPVFEYSCKSKMGKPVGPLGMMLNATEACSRRCELWTKLLPELQEALVDNGNSISKAFDSLSLQVHIMCQQESNGCYSTFCRFDINKQMCLCIDLKSRSWTELHPGCRSLKETLENDRYVTSLLVDISHGECGKLLNQSIVLDTKAAPTTAAASASSSASSSSSSPTVSATPTMATTTVPAPSKARNTQKNMPRIPWVLVSCVISVLFIICCIICCIIYKYGWQKRCCSKAPESGSSSGRVSSGWLPFRRRQELTCDQELQPL